MECLVKTTDPVRLTLIESLLSSADIPYFVFDQHMSALEAGVAIFPRRVMVTEAYIYSARTLLQDNDQFFDD